MRETRSPALVALHASQWENLVVHYSRRPFFIIASIKIESFSYEECLFDISRIVPRMKYCRDVTSDSPCARANGTIQMPAAFALK
jgi:hypothetical protein